MAWIKVYDTLPDHPKVIEAARALGMDKDLLTGKLVRLWTWALTNRENGKFHRHDAETVAEAMRYKGDPDTLLGVMVKAGFVDETPDGYALHDWTDYAGDYVEKRAQTAERVRKHRQMKRQCNASVTQNSVTESVTPALHERYTSVSVTPLEKEREKENNIYVTAYRAGAREGDAETLEKQQNENPRRDTAFASIIATYETNIRMPTAIEIDKINQWYDDTAAEVITFAIEQAALSGIRSWNGVEAILRRWMDIGVKTRADAEAAQREWQNRRQKPAQPTQGKETPRYDFNGAFAGQSIF